MRLISAVAFCFTSIALLGAQAVHPDSQRPKYTQDGRLLPPTSYREWIYLTSGFDMSYTPSVAAMGGHSMFDNVFVNPEAYRVFLQSGTWPDKTMLVLEGRAAESRAAINKAGHFQGEERMNLEVHVKDAARGGWSFYEFDGDAPGKRFPSQSDCYSCHRDHAAVDTTFVQFYPTLLPLARQKRTLSARYMAEEAAAGPGSGGRATLGPAAPQSLKR